MDRFPRGYDGQACTTRDVRFLLPKILDKIALIYESKGEAVLKAWPLIIGEKLAPMTQAMSFADGLLAVVVKNSTLYSLLVQHERGKLLIRLRERFPHITIKNIIFRIG